LYRDGGGTGSRGRRPHRKSGTVPRAVAEHIEKCQPSGVDSVDEFSASIFEDSAATGEGALLVRAEIL